eukprot:CFRG1526T1
MNYKQSVMTSPEKTASSHVPELGVVTKHNAKLIKYFNNAVFPVSYNEKFYEEIVTMGEFAKLAYYADVMVGSVCCKFVPDEDDEKKRTCYIMTLGCLERYRRVGVGSLLLKHILKQCGKDSTITQIRLHVQTSNTVAMDFYKKFDFRTERTIESYYKDIDPSDAYLLVKDITHDSQIINGVSKIAL